MDSAQRQHIFETIIALLNRYLRSGKEGTVEQGQIRRAYELLAMSEPGGKITIINGYPNNELRNALQHVADALLEEESYDQAELNCARGLRHFLHARRDIHALTAINWRNRVHSNILHLENGAHDTLPEFKSDLAETAEKVRQLKIPKCDSRGPVAVVMKEIELLEVNCENFDEVLADYMSLHKRMCDRYPSLKERQVGSIFWAQLHPWRWREAIIAILGAIIGGLIVEYRLELYRLMLEFIRWAGSLM